MKDHPGIVFRDGPTGRRAALAGGPDVWAVIETLHGTALSGAQAVAATAEWGNLTPVQLHAAVQYYGDYRVEIDERIRLNRQEAERRRSLDARRRSARRRPPERREKPRKREAL